jgi:hypothetical protein
MPQGTHYPWFEGAETQSCPSYVGCCGRAEAPTSFHCTVGDLSLTHLYAREWLQKDFGWMDESQDGQTGELIKGWRVGSLPDITSAYVSWISPQKFPFHSALSSASTVFLTLL